MTIRTSERTVNDYFSSLLIFLDGTANNLHNDPRMTPSVTTAQIAREEGITQRVIQKRIKRLGIQPMRVGSVFLLTINQAERVRRDKRKPGPKPKAARAKQSNGNGHK